MRTNVILDDELLARAMRLTGEHTKTGVLHLGLRTLVRQAELARLRRLRGKLKWTGDLDRLRERHP